MLFDKFIANQYHEFHITVLKYFVVSKLLPPWRCMDRSWKSNHKFSLMWWENLQTLLFPSPKLQLHQLQLHS